MYYLGSRERGVFAPPPFPCHSRQPRYAFKMSDWSNPKHKSFTSVYRHKGESDGLQVDLNVEGLRTYPVIVWIPEMSPLKHFSFFLI